MSDAPLGIEVEGVRCWRSRSDPATFLYLPGDPSPERDPAGRPTLLLMARDRGASLQLGARWTVETALLEKLRKALADRFADLDPGAIRLSPAPMTVEPVALLAGDGQGRMSELATARSSGFPPYAALFNLSLNDDQRNTAGAALNGLTGRLVIRYRASLPMEVSAETALAGEVRDDLAALGAAAALEECRRQIDDAIAGGRLTVSRNAAAGAPDELRARADALALDKAARLLCEMSRQAPARSAQSRLEASAVVEDTVPIALERTSDVGSWFAAGEGAGHIRVLPGATVPGPAAASRTVKLGFDPGDAPLAFVQASLGTSRAILRPPAFEPATVAGGGDALAVKTQYTDGGPPFETKVGRQAAEGWSLAPAALGLVRIALDGSALAASGARAARIDLRYRPSADGTADDRSVHLRNGAWTAEWYVVSRSSGLEGTIELEGMRTAADGTIDRIQRATTTETELRL